MEGVGGVAVATVAAMAEVGPSARAGAGRAVVEAAVVWGTVVAWAVSWRAGVAAVRAGAVRAAAEKVVAR